MSAVVTVTAKPDMEQTLKEVLRVLTIHARDNEGCINYKVQRDVHNRRTFVLLENSSNRSTFEAHGVAPHKNVYIRAVGPLVEARAHQKTTFKACTFLHDL